MEIKKSVGPDTQISLVNANKVGNNCEISWHTASGGVIVCVTPGFSPWPDAESLNDDVLCGFHSVLFDGSIVDAAFQNGTPCRLQYLSESMIAAVNAKVSVPATGHFTFPLKVQIWCSDDKKRTVYSTYTTSNRQIVQAEATATTEIRKKGLFKKEKVLTAKMKINSQFPDGVLCYTVSGGTTDADGEPIEYPIPNRFLGNEIIVPQDKVYTVKASKQWEELITVKIIGGR